MTGRLFVISAPSGAGKTSLVHGVVDQLECIKVSISYTTRPMRREELDSVDYHFISVEKFHEMVNQGLFLEYAEVFGNFYGTGQHWVEEQLSDGYDVILEIDWQGAEQIRRLFPEAIGVFILPPSLEALRTRLLKRGQDQLDDIEHRIEEAQTEISHYTDYNYIIVNDSFDRALAELRAVILSLRLKIGAQQHYLCELLNKLMASK